MELKDIKKAILFKTVVIHDDCEYYITAIYMRLTDNGFKYYVELHDLYANSICSAKFEDIKMKE